MLIIAKSMLNIEKLKKLLCSEFEMKDLSATKKILGMEIHKDKKAGMLYLSPKKYIEQLGVQNSMPLSTPLATHFRLSSALSS